MTRVVVLLAAVLAAAAAVQGSQATFTASATNSGTSFVTASKFPPTVTLTAPANGSVTNDTTPLFTGTADTATGDSTIVTIRVYSGTSNAVTFKVDTAAPTAVSVSGDNMVGGTAGKIEAGDTLTYTYSEAIQPSSVWSGWNGSATTVHIRFTSSGNDTITVLTTSNGTGINLGSVATNADYVSATATFNATMAMSADGTAVVLTLGTPTNVNASASPGRNMSWTVGAGIKDLAGNTIVTPATFNETSSDVDF